MSPYSASGICATYVQALKAMSTVLADCLLPIAPMPIAPAIVPVIIRMPIMTPVVIIGLFEREGPVVGICRVFAAGAPNKTPVGGEAGAAGERRAPRGRSV